MRGFFSTTNDPLEVCSFCVFFYLFCHSFPYAIQFLFCSFPFCDPLHFVIEEVKTIQNNPLELISLGKFFSLWKRVTFGKNSKFDWLCLSTIFILTSPSQGVYIVFLDIFFSLEVQLKLMMCRYKKEGKLTKNNPFFRIGKMLNLRPFEVVQIEISAEPFPNAK